MKTMAQILVVVLGLMIFFWLLKVAFKLAVVLIGIAIAVAGVRAIWNFVQQRH